MKKKDISNLNQHRGLYKYIDDMSGFHNYSDDMNMTSKNVITGNDWHEEPFEPYKYSLTNLTNYRIRHKIKRPEGENELVSGAGFVTWDTWTVPLNVDTRYLFSSGQVNYV